MRKKSLLALLAFATFAAAVVVGMSSGAALGGEVTGNCNHATNDQSASNCKDEFSNGNSWCRFSARMTIQPPLIPAILVAIRGIGDSS